MVARLRAGLAVAAVTLCLTAAASPPVSASEPGANGKIYFSARVDGASNDNEILSINPDGTGLANVTPPVTHVPQEFDGDNSDPAVSGDGAHFIWLTNRCWDVQPTPYCGTHQIGLANADGSGQQRLTSLASSDQETPTISPDGTKIAFESNSSGNTEIWLEDLVTGSLEQVTHTGQTNTVYPAFSPDGTQLAYDSVGHVWVVDLGTGITVDLGGGAYPSWSPDGTQIAFMNGRSGAPEIWRSKLDGSGAVQLTFLGCSESNPSWSPDGSLIVFHSSCDDGLDIASAVDGSGRRMLIGDHTPFAAVGAAELPDWQTVPALPPPRAPTVTSVTPVDGSAGVGTSTTVSATFSLNMDPSTITATTFTLTGPAGDVTAAVDYDPGSRTATLVPSAALVAGTKYTAALSTAVKSADGVALIAVFSWTFTTASGVSAPPTVVSTSPADGSTGVPTTATVSATFSRAVDVATITTGSFLVASSSGPVPATVAYDTTTKTATLAPSAPLADLTVYTATITTGVTADGVSLSASYSWSFTTAAAPLAVISTEPDGTRRVPVDTPISVTFDRALDPTTVTVSSIEVINRKSERVSSSVSYVPGTMTVTLDAALVYASDYEILIQTGVRAADGGLLAQQYSVLFTTVGLPPTVTSTVPADGASDVQVDTTVAATFSRQLDPSTVTPASFELTGPSGPVAAAVTEDASGRQVTLTPAAVLDQGATYTVSIAATVTAFDGVAVAQPYSWSFKTHADSLRLVSSVPATGTSDVLPDTPITATFNKPLDPTTVNTSNIFLTSGATPVPATVSYAAGSTTVTVTPMQPLAYGTPYAVRFSDTVVAADGGVFAEKDVAIFTFFTVAQPAPSFLLPADGATNVEPLFGVFVEFDEVMDFSTIDASSFTLRDATGALVPATVAFNGKGWTLAPLAPLAYGATYTATLDSTIRAADGIAMAAPVSWSFTTTADRTPPIIVPTITGTLGDNGWYTSDVTLAWSVSDPESPSSLSITPFECVSESITTDQTDETYLCGASSFGGAAQKAVDIKRDATPPVISLSGNLRSYTVDAEVHIACSASDAVSGVAPCSAIVGPAYSFALGLNSIARSVRDNAGNQASATALFTVSVTAASLCTLTSRFAGSSSSTPKRNVDAIVQAACSSLNTIAKAKKSQVSAYTAHVAKLLGDGDITADQAAILDRLAAAL